MTISKTYHTFNSCFLSCFLSAALMNFAGSSKSQQQNQPPVVKIVNPKSNSSINISTPLSYEITVSDKDDGDSKYDEINAKEVLLEVRFLKDKSKVAALNKTIQPDAPGLAAIRTSNCFSCHNFNSKAMGPSFYEIAL